MHKSKQPRRSRLIRKWDGTPVVDAELAGQSAEPAAPLPVADSVHSDDRRPVHDKLIYDFDDEELSDTLEH